MDLAPVQLCGGEPPQSERFLLIVSFVLDVAGVAVFILREELGGPDLFAWERGLLMAGYLVAAIVVVLLGSALQTLRSVIVARMVTFSLLMAVALAVTAEVSLVMEGFRMEKDWGLVMVVLLFVAEAIIGVALLNSDFVPPWAASTLILWNAFWLVVQLIVASRAVYFPILHFIPLLVIGIALAGQARHMPTSKPA